MCCAEREIERERERELGGVKSMGGSLTINQFMLKMYSIMVHTVSPPSFKTTEATAGAKGRTFSASSDPLLLRICNEEQNMCTRIVAENVYLGAEIYM